ncbi:MAG: hypothetical protein HFF43_08610, partial [Lawsonibacter sp.]|nr:hypothetical protein [Lawsonibacter sp.]
MDAKRQRIPGQNPNHGGERQVKIQSPLIPKAPGEGLNANPPDQIREHNQKQGALGKNQRKQAHHGAFYPPFDSRPGKKRGRAGQQKDWKHDKKIFSGTLQDKLYIVPVGH